jgi:hypothetical protein
VYFAQRPFHPGRLLETALSSTWQGVLRTKVGCCTVSVRGLGRITGFHPGSF